MCSLIKISSFFPQSFCVLKRTQSLVNYININTYCFIRIMFGVAIAFLVIAHNLYDINAAVTYGVPGQHVLRDHNIPESCKNLNYCEMDPVGFPIETINAIIGESQLVSESQSPIKELLRPKRLAMGSEDDNYVSLCESEVKLIYPRVVKGSNGTWHMVANSKNSVQRFRVELCKETNAPCVGIMAIDTNFETTCKQIMGAHEVSVFKDGDDEIITTHFPVSCSCYLKRQPF